MIAQAKADEVTLTYDPSRGGFSLEFCHMRPAAPHFNLFDGSMRARITSDLRVASVGSFWDRGGLLLNTLYHKPNEPRDWNLHRNSQIALADGLTQSDPFVVRQTLKDIEIWFGSEPMSQPPTHHDSKTLISVWLAAERVRHHYCDPSFPSYGKFEKPVVVGIRLEYSHLAATYPMKSLLIWIEDFK